MQNFQPYFPATLSDDRMPGGRLATCRPQVDEMRIFSLQRCHEICRVARRYDWPMFFFFFAITLELCSTPESTLSDYP